MAEVLIILGSQSDHEFGEKCQKTLEKFGLTSKLVVSSAHRHPEKTAELASTARREGVRVIICMAGMSAALPGVVAARTDLPVIGVPLSGSSLGGLEALLSVVQMPKGGPVAAMALDKHGAVNAAILATRIIALLQPGLYNKLNEYGEELSGK